MCAQGHDVNTPNDSPRYTTSLQKRKIYQSHARNLSGASVIMRGSLVKNPFTGSVSSDLFLIKREWSLHLSEAFTSTDSTREAEDAFKSSACRVHAQSSLICTPWRVWRHHLSRLHSAPHCTAVKLSEHTGDVQRFRILTTPQSVHTNYPTECAELEFMSIWALGWEQIYTS